MAAADEKTKAQMHKRITNWAEKRTKTLKVIRPNA